MTIDIRTLLGLKEKTVGGAQGGRRYDLPLNKGAGTGFLILLIALMSFIAVIALSASFALSTMKDRWTSGLQNRVTVEIPAEDADGNPLSPEESKALTARVAAVLRDHPAVSSLHVLDDAEITELVKPWLGESSGILLEKVPVPGLIGIETENTEPGTMTALGSVIRSVAPAARLDTHEDWLRDVLRFASALGIAAVLLAVVIGLTAAAAVAGAIRARLTVHAAEVELLHLMGAPDSYITRQFRRHSLILALQGGAAGTALGGLTVFLTAHLAGRSGSGLLPGFHFDIAQVMILAALPLAAAGLAAITADRTVNSVLARMP